MTYSESIELFLKTHPYQEMRVDGAVFRYVTAGEESAPCVVFLNGGMNCSEMWFQYVEKMSGEYRTLIFDYPQELKTCEETIAAMRSFFMRLGIKKAFFAGASFGGIMAQLWARAYPETVTGLGLFSTAGLDENTIRSAGKKYRFLPLLLWHMKRCNYEKLKTKLINNSLKRYARQETPENQQYLREMFEWIFRGYTREKDMHITSMMAGAVDTNPCVAEDFAFVRDRVLLVFPEKDFFSEEEQASLRKLFPSAAVQSIRNGHFGTVLECDRYTGWMRNLIADA